MDLQTKNIYDSAVNYFSNSGKYAWHFARGKLRYDPIFFSLLKRGVLPDRGKLLDLGCGQGVLMALLLAARQQFNRGQWPHDWPKPPMHLDIHGIELRPDRVRAAQKAFAGEAIVELGDIRHTDFSDCAVISILDVLLYLDENAQIDVLERLSKSLPCGGLLLLREADASAGTSFQITQWAERIAGIAYGRLWQKLSFRSSHEWKKLLEQMNFSVEMQSMSEGTPFANVLYVATKK